MTLDADLQALHDNEQSKVNDKVYCLQMQAIRDYNNSLLRIGTEENFEVDYRKELYLKCLEKACDLRKQAMSTATTPTTEDKIVSDVARITEKLFDVAQAGLSARGLA